MPHPTDSVPDGFRTDRLPEPVRGWVDSKARVLAETLEIALDDTREDVDYNSKRENILASRHVNWWGSESERNVAFLGKTFKGSFITSSREPVMIKFTPDARLGEEIPSPSACGNIHELLLWQHAVSNGFQHLFGTIKDYSERGDWLAMTGYIPLYRNSSPDHSSSIDWVAEDTLSKPYIPALDEQLQANGIDGHFKYGNVGLPYDRSEDDHAVLIDYGCHVHFAGKKPEMFRRDPADEWL